MAAATVVFSPSFQLSLSLEGDSLVCVSNHGQTKHLFGESERDALLTAAHSFLHIVSVPLATALSLLSHLFWLVRHTLNRQVSTPIPVTLGKERSVHHDPIAAVCAAFLLLVDPMRETGQVALARFIYSFAPPSALPPQRTALAALLAEAAVSTFIHTLRAAACFQLEQDEISGLVKIPRLSESRLQWLSHNDGFLPVLRQLATTRIVAFHELVAVVIAVFGRSPPADETQDLVGAALDVAAGATCRINDLTAATRDWLGRTPFSPTVSQLEVQKLHQLDDNAFSVWAFGICSTQPAPPTFRLSGFLADPEWPENILRDLKRKRPVPEEPENKKKRVRFTPSIDEEKWKELF
jgi:hypothetical protein